MTSLCQGLRRSAGSGDEDPENQVAKIYDPIGFAAAIIVRAKISMQQLREMGYDLDQALPPKTLIELFEELEELNKVTFPRCLTPVDAVGFAYAMCVL